MEPNGVPSYPVGGSVPPPQSSPYVYQPQIPVQAGHYTATAPAGDGPTHVVTGSCPPGTQTSGVGQAGAATNSTQVVQDTSAPLVTVTAWEHPASAPVASSSQPTSVPPGSLPTSAPVAGSGQPPSAPVGSGNQPPSVPQSGQPVSAPPVSTGQPTSALPSSLPTSAAMGNSGQPAAASAVASAPPASSVQQASAPVAGVAQQAVTQPAGATPSSRARAFYGCPKRRRRAGAVPRWLATLEFNSSPPTTPLLQCLGVPMGPPSAAVASPGLPPFTGQPMPTQGITNDQQAFAPSAPPMLPSVPQPPQAPGQMYPQQAAPMQPMMGPPMAAGQVIQGQPPTVQAFPQPAYGQPQYAAPSTYPQQVYPQQVYSPPPPQQQQQPVYAQPVQQVNAQPGLCATCLRSNLFMHSHYSNSSSRRMAESPPL
ncbi:hypothetical protein FOZ60_014663 [Perkinsus olseni]|uniref:Uncharacterized protein n=1 Tax=Perkinsus olseni TaxID=32597 RepID=A0A7J6PN09_PEROL|nr:hypothetical protein FOZ60_014663 [Perkinsus olseni]